MEWLVGLWRRLALDPNTGQLSATFLQAVILPLFVAIILGAFRPVRAMLARMIRALVRAAGLLSKGRARPSWDVPEVDTLKREGRILIIDDENFAHFEQLPLRGFNVTHWKTIDREKATRLDEEFDVLILDVKGVQDCFGAKDGIEALELLRRDNPWIPIMLNTAYLGDLSESRRQLVKAHTQGAASKLIRYHEFEEQVMHLLQLGRSFEYFLSILRGLDVAEPVTVMRLIEATNGTPTWTFEADVKPAAFQKDQVVSVLHLARSSFTGARWKHRN